MIRNEFVNPGSSGWLPATATDSTPGSRDAF